jgi:general secretion pathway protein A
MYETDFSLREPAFAMTSDPRFLWPSDTHEEGLASLYYGITRRKGFILLTGEVGVGKTALLRSVLNRLPGDARDAPGTALVTNTAGLSPLDLLKLIAAEFQIGGGQQTQADYIIALDSFLRERRRSELNTILIIDEAQNLDTKALEQVRLLSNIETEREKLLQIVLAGQPELRARLAHHSLRSLRQRIAVEHHLEPLQPEDILPYLHHRIEVAGGRYDQVFAPGCDQVLSAFSGGRPRLINHFADRCPSTSPRARPGRSPPPRPSRPRNSKATTRRRSPRFEAP